MGLFELRGDMLSARLTENYIIPRHLHAIFGEFQAIA